MLGRGFDGASAATRYAVMNLDELVLALPQSGIRTLEPLADVQTGQGEHNEVGWVDAEGGPVPVYCLDRDLNLVARIPESRRIVVLLSTGGGALGILCDAIVSLAADEFRLEDLAECLRGRWGALSGLIVHDGRVGGVTTAELLAGRIEAMGVGQRP